MQHNEADQETAYRVLKHCHPNDQVGGANIVAQYRRHIIRDFRCRLIKAYAEGNVDAYIRELNGES